jgi:phage shock protein C
LPLLRHDGSGARRAAAADAALADRRIAGVCGGIADYLNVDSTIVRLAWVVLSIWPGAIICGVLAYAVAWLVIPATPAPTLQPSPSTS